MQARYLYFHKSSSIFEGDKITETTAYRAVHSKGSEATRRPYVPCHLVVSYRLMTEPILAAEYEVSGTVCNTCVEIELKFSTMVRHSRRIHHDSARAKPDRKSFRPERSGADPPAAQQFEKMCSPLYLCTVIAKFVPYQALQRVRAYHHSLV